MQKVEVVQSYEQAIQWKVSLPCVILTSGARNNFTLTLRQMPTAASPSVIDAKYYRLSIRELIDQSKTVLTVDADAVIPDGSTALEVSLNVADGMKRGYYVMHIILKDSSHTPIDVFTTYAVVDREINPKDGPYMSLESVRTQFGDLAGANNALLEGQEFSAGDIADSVKRAVEQWNDAPPRVSIYSGHNFPYPEILRRGVVYMLIQSLWAQLERNRMAYNSGGVDIDLQRRADAYAKLKEEYLVMWSAGLRQAKTQESMLSFNNSMGYW